MKYSRIALCLVAAAAASLAPAQFVSGVVTQSGPFSFNVTITDATGHGVTLLTPCLFMIVKLDRPDGQVITAYPCAAVPTPIPPCGSRSQSYTPTVGGYGSVYWFQINFYDSAMNQHTEYFPGSIPNPSGGTSLVAQTPAQIGTALVLQLTSTTLPGSAYIVAMSQTTNVGIALAPPLFVALDPDWIFALSFPTPDPTLFTNFQGTLSGAGTATAVANIPYLPYLLCQPLHAEAAILSTSTSGVVLAVSNPLSFTIM